MTTVAKHLFLHPNMTPADWDRLTDEQWDSLSTQEIIDHDPGFEQQILRSEKQYHQGKHRAIKDPSCPSK